MHALARLRALAPRHDVPARIGRAIARRTLRADQLRCKATRRKAFVQIFANLAVVFARRIEGRNADKVLRQRDKIVASGDDSRAQQGRLVLLPGCRGHVALNCHGRTIGQTPCRDNPVSSTHRPTGNKVRPEKGLGAVDIDQRESVPWSVTRWQAHQVSPSGRCSAPAPRVKTEGGAYDVHHFCIVSLYLLVRVMFHQALTMPVS